MALLSVYVLNYLYLALVGPEIPPPAWTARAGPILALWPRVTVQLPIYNELYVAARLVAAAAALDYPPRPAGDPGPG